VVRRAAALAATAAFLAGAGAADAARPAREPLSARAGGFLTAPSERKPARVALDYVREHPATFGLDEGDLAGLRLARSYRSESGATHLQWEQYYRGIPVFGPGLRANVDADGRLLNVGDGAQPDPAAASIEPRLSALDALLAAGRAAGIPVVPGSPDGSGQPDRATSFANGQRASLTIFGGDRLAWRVLVRGGARQAYDAVVDANSGETLYRVSLVRQATGLAFDNYPGAPNGGVQVAKVFSESGDDPWLTNPNRLAGDNAHVYSDPGDDINPFTGSAPAAGDEIPFLVAGDWSHPQEAHPPTSAAAGQHCPATPGCSWDNFDPTPPNFSWRDNREQAGTQLFYFVNRYHDHLRDAVGIGFDDSSGNFEGADRVQGQVDNGATTDTAAFDDFPDCDHINNASATVPPDGLPLVMEIYLWSNACTPTQLAVNDVNAADDGLIVYHEYTHGMNNRLVTDAAGFPALNGPQPGAMDEGFADWYAIDTLNAQGFEPDSATPGELVPGRYENDQIRTQAFDCPVGMVVAQCPAGGYTYGDFGRIASGPEVHADGEIWVETLWDLRTRLIADHGAGEGINRARALITDGLRLAPGNPTYLDMRNAILQADLNRGFGDRDRIWAVFAARGMGFRASTTGNLDTAPVQDFSLPPAVQPPPPPPPAGDTTRPSVSRLSLSRRRFKRGSGTAFIFRLSEASTVRIAIDRTEAGRRVGRRCRAATRGLRRRPRCTRYLRQGTLLRPNLRPGAQRVSFNGRLRSRALRVGAYRATIFATDPAGNRSRGAQVTFRVVRR
jgi:hypothetical protein